MGKGGGCMPSKHKTASFVVSDQCQSGGSISIEDRNPEKTEATLFPFQDSTDVRKLRIFIVFYSMYRHVECLGRIIKKGVDAVEGVEGILYRVPETLEPQALDQMKVPPKNDEIPVISAEVLVEADGLLFGFPTRYGSMAGQMKAFFDSTAVLWREQKLAGVPAGFFVSTGTQGGGQETTILTAVTQLAHHGMVYVPIGYTFGADMFEMGSIRGGSPYGAGVFSGDGSREPTETELALAEYQGKYMAIIVKKFARSKRNS